MTLALMLVNTLASQLVWSEATVTFADLRRHWLTFLAVVFSGVIAGTARRSLALWLTVLLTAVVIASRWGFGLDPRMAVGVYLLMSVVQVLTLTHAWDFAGDLLTGRQAKRLAPLLGMWASVGALLGGALLGNPHSPGQASNVSDKRLVLLGLNALARAHELDYFADGHRGAAMVSAHLLCVDNDLDELELVRAISTLQGGKDLAGFDLDGAPSFFCSV